MLGGRYHLVFLGDFTLGDALVRILALHPDVEITSRHDAPFGVVVVGSGRRCVLDRTEQAALWHACGASPRSGDLPPSSPDVVELLAQRLLGEGLFSVAERPPGQVARDQHLALAANVDLKSAFYEIAVEGRESTSLISELGVMLFESCDGRRAVPELHALAQDRGYVLEVADVAKQITQLQGVGLVSRGLAPRRDGNGRVRLKAVVARAPGDFGYLISSDEAEILSRFRSPRLVQDLLSTQPSQADRQWLFAFLGKAAAVGLLVPSAADLAEDLSGEFDQDQPTEISYAALDDLEPAVPNRNSTVPSRPTPAPIARPTPPPAVRPSAPPVTSRTSPMPAIQQTPARSAPMQAVQPMPAQPMPMPMPVSRSAQMPVAPARPSTQLGTVEPPAPMARPSSQFGSATHERPQLAIGTPPPDPAAQARLASLSALSLDKGAEPSVSTSRRQSSGGSSKLPWILLVLVIGGGGYYHYTTTRNLPKQPVAGGSETVGSNTTPTKPVASPGAVLLTASAYVEAKRPIVLSANATGLIKEILVDAGDSVKKGQVVARIDDSAIKARLSSAGSRVSAAAKNLAAVKKLYKIQAKTALDVANAEAALQVAQSEIPVIKQELQSTKITSPIDGNVVERLLQPGENVQSGGGVMRLADLSKLVAAVDINEGELKNVKPGAPAEIVVDAAPGDPYKGTVSDIAQQADRTRGTVLVKVDIVTDPARPLKPGMAVQVRFKAPELPPAPAEGSAAGSGSAAPAGAAAGSGTQGTPAN